MLPLHWILVGICPPLWLEEKSKYDARGKKEKTTERQDDMVNPVVFLVRSLISGLPYHTLEDNMV